MPAQSLNIVSFYVSMLILKVQKRPELEAGIRDSDLDSIVEGLLSSFRQVWMFVNIENAPSGIVLEILVFSSFGVLLRGSLQVDGSLHQGFWIAPRVDPQLDEALGLDSKVVEIMPFRNDSFANNQDPALYFSVGTATPQTIISSRHHLQPSWSRTRPNE